MGEVIASEPRGAEGGTDCPQSVSMAPVNVLGTTRSTFDSVDDGPEPTAPCFGQRDLSRLRRRRNRYSWRSRRTLVLRAAKTENQKENKRQQNQTNSKAYAFSEALCHVDAKNDPDDKIYERDEHQDYPPTGPACDLADEIRV